MLRVGSQILRLGFSLPFLSLLFLSRILVTLFFVCQSPRDLGWISPAGPSLFSAVIVYGPFSGVLLCLFGVPLCQELESRFSYVSLLLFVELSHFFETSVVYPVSHLGGQPVFCLGVGFGPIFSSTRFRISSLGFLFARDRVDQ